MADLSATLRVVKIYLEYSGYRVSDMTIENGKVKQDGHWLLAWCIHYGSGDMCPCGLDAALKALFKMLEGGKETLGQPPRIRQFVWTRKATNMVLARGGFKEWPEEDV